jgi:hypothetical protein
VELNIDTLHDAEISSKFRVALVVKQFSIFTEMEGKYCFHKIPQFDTIFSQLNPVFFSLALQPQFGLGLPP